MKVTLHPPLCLHEIGQRENNEDNVFPPKGSVPQSGPYQLYLVCDGVGGMEKGEVASQIACDVISSHLAGQTNVSKSDIDQAVWYAEQEIGTYIEENIDALGMATTLTLLRIQDDGIIIAHLGDSRIYHVRGGQILHKTYDHSFVNELLSKKIITEEEAKNHPKRNVVTKAIMGGGEHQVPDFNHFQNILPGDYFFLCTDGITESISDPELASILNTSNLSNEKKLKAIKHKCREHSKDNHSAYLLQIKHLDRAGLAKTISAVIKSKPWHVIGILAGALIVVLIAFLASSGNRESNEKHKNKRDKIENSLLILDSIKIDNMNLTETDILSQEDTTISDVDTLPKTELSADSLPPDDMQAEGTDTSRGNLVSPMNQ